MNERLFITVLLSIKGEKGVFIKTFSEHDLEQRSEYVFDEAWNLFYSACNHLQTSLYSNLVIEVETIRYFYEWDHITGYRNSTPVFHDRTRYVFERMPVWVHFQP